MNLFALASATLSSSTLKGTVTSQTAAMAGTVADVELSVLETTNSVTYTIPLAPISTQNAATLSLETASSGGTMTCPNGTDCADHSLVVPSGAANVGAWSSSGTPLAPNITLATYKIDAVAFVPSSGGLADCSPPEQTTPAFTLSAGGNHRLRRYAFLHCVPIGPRT